MSRKGRREKLNQNIHGKEKNCEVVTVWDTAFFFIEATTDYSAAAHVGSEPRTAHKRPQRREKR